MWTPLQLRRLRRDIEGGSSLKAAAQCVGHNATDCDLALRTMLGRSIEDALTILNGSEGQGAGGVSSPVRLGR